MGVQIHVCTDSSCASRPTFYPFHLDLPDTCSNNTSPWYQEIHLLDDHTLILETADDLFAHNKVAWKIGSVA